MHALLEVRPLKHGDLLAAAVNGQIEGVSRLHAEYLKEMAELGVPSRRSDLPVRVEAHNHGSVHGYEEELLSNAWKDAAYGAVLLVDPSRPGVAEILESSRVAESPLGRVPKQNPDRTISSEGRPINDMRLQNSKGSKFNHPPAPQPRHQSVARQSLWRHARHPGVPQRCAKRDVPRAFKWHFLRISDVSEFAVKLAGIIIISLVTPFGWVGAPGEFVAWSMAAQAHHRLHAPPTPEWNDIVPYESKWLMDDGVVLEPLVGNRIHHSLACLDETMKLAWGPEGVNVEKMAEEGHPSACQLFLRSPHGFRQAPGLSAGAKADQSQVSDGGGYPPERLRSIPLKLFRAQYWSAVCPELRPYLPILYSLMHVPSGAEDKWATPRPGEDPELLWEEFWDALDFIFDSNLNGRFGPVSTPPLKSYSPSVSCWPFPGWQPGAGWWEVTQPWAVSELSIGKLAGFMVSETEDFATALKEVLPDSDQVEIIAIMELLAFIVFATQEGNGWGGEVVFYVTDNQNVQTWLAKRRPKVRAARRDPPSASPRGGELL